MRSDILRLLENPSRKFKFHGNLTRVTGTLHEYLCTFVALSLGIHLRMGNLADKNCRENRITHFLFNNFSENRTVYDMWKNMLESRRQRMTI